MPRLDRGRRVLYPVAVTGSQRVPPDLELKVQNELSPGEHVEWMDMPVPKYFTPAAASAFLLGIPWTAFALFWTGAAAWGTTKAGGAGLLLAFPLFGLPFILIGFAMLSSPLWARWRALGTVYVITNRRAITFDGGRTTTIRSYPPDRLQEVYRRERPDGTGDVILVRRAWRDSDNDGQSEELGFLRVRDPKTVESRIRALADAGRVPPQG